MDRKYDIVIFGATGFTGQYVVEEVARTADEIPGLKWAIAGRAMSKCQKVLEAAAKHTGKPEVEEIPIIIADIKVQQSLLDMTNDARIILNCVGPYRFYGDQVVRACVENKTHHLDISGEPAFLEKMQLLYHTKAKENGCYIVGACGFDSIPSDMGVIFTREKFGGELNGVEGYFAVQTGPEGGKGHYATFESAVHGFGSVSELIKNRKLLFTTKLPSATHRLPRRENMFFSKDVDGHCIAFPGSDRSVVVRTQRFMYEEEKKRPVQFNAFVRMPSKFYAYVIAIVGTIFQFLAGYSFGRKILLAFPGLFSYGMFSHDGPTKKQIDGTSFSYTFFGSGYDKKLSVDEKPESEPTKTIVTKVVGPEPGYATTPICMVQAAYTVLKDQDKMPDQGGVYTTGAAFSKTKLIERLDEHNIKFTVIEQ